MTEFARRRRLVVVIVSVLGVDWVMDLLRMGPTTLLVVAYGLFVATAVVCLRSSWGTASVLEIHSVASERSAVSDARVRMLSDAVRGIETVRYSARLQRTLVEIIDDQLERVHGVKRVDNPDASRRILGPELFALTEQVEPSSTLSGTADLERIVALVERL